MNAPIDAPAITAAALVAWAESPPTLSEDELENFTGAFAAGVAWSARRLLGVLDGERAERVAS